MWQIILIVLTACLYTLAALDAAKALYNRFGSIPFSLDAPDMWVFVATILLWAAASRYLQPWLTTPAKIALWLVLFPMTWLFLLAYGVMRIPG